MNCMFGDYCRSASAFWEQPVRNIHDEYRAFEKVHIRESLKKKEVDEAELDSFLRRVFYLAFDSTNSAEYHKLKDRIHQLQQEQQLPDKIIYYLATPPVMYELIPTCLKENGMNVAGSEDGWRRVIVEKLSEEPRIGRTTEQASYSYLR